MGVLEMGTREQYPLRWALCVGICDSVHVCIGTHSHIHTPTHGISADRCNLSNVYVCVRVPMHMYTHTCLFLYMIPF